MTATFTESVVADAAAMDTLTGDQLVVELERLGLRYLSRSASQEPSAPLAPDALIAGLAASPEARLRSALIPLFLWRPDYASAAWAVGAHGRAPQPDGHAPPPDGRAPLPDKARLMLQCCYSAAVALQRRYAVRLAQLGRPVTPLPDIFAVALDLPPMADPAARLAAVAARHAQLSGEAINWLGTYEQAAATFLRFVAPIPA
jgi:hypothetical protein